MPSALTHWDRLLARLTASVVPITRRIIAGVGLYQDQDTLAADINIRVRPHSDGSIVADSDGVGVGVITDAQHGSRAGGTTHANAIASGAAGFLSGADKAKLDGITAGAAGLTSSAPTTIQPDDSAAVGSAVTASRADHVHAIVAAAPGTIQPDDSAAEGSATSFARSDHRHAIAAATAGAIAIGDSAAEGSSTSFARADHTHSLAAPSAPVSPGIANATGSATSPARADHVHALQLPTYTVGTLPSAASNTRVMIYVSDEAGGAVPAFSDGTDWRRMTDRAVVS